MTADKATSTRIEWEGVKKSEGKMKHTEKEPSGYYRVCNCPASGFPRMKGNGQPYEETRVEIPRRTDVFLCAIFCLLATTLAILCAAPFADFSGREGITAAGDAVRRFIQEDPALSVFIGMDDTIVASSDLSGPNSRQISVDNDISYLSCSAEEYIANPPLRDVRITGGMPCAGTVISGFSFRDNPLYGLTETARYEFHSGIDIPAEIGTAVSAFADGTVLTVGEDAGRGIYVELDHGSGWTTIYAHLSSVDVTKGQQVAAGEKIAGTGASGRVTGPHLHFELRQNGTPVDPEQYIK